MPALHLFPGGTEGGVFVSGTVLVPSGRRIGLMQLFVDPARALPVLASEFKKAFARQGRERGGCVKWVPKALEPTAHNYRHFALLPTALAIGVTGYGNCMQLVATVPYAELRPHFSDLARILIDAVRRPSGS